MNSGNSRFLELEFTQKGNQITAKLPDNGLRLMPGWYMLFGMVDDIPSIAQMVKIEAGKLVSANQEVSTPVKGLRIFPNPVATGNGVTVEMELKKASRVDFVVQDVVGKTVKEFSFSEKSVGNQVFTLQMAGLPKGTYFLTARLDEEVQGIEKIMLK